MSQFHAFLTLPDAPALAEADPSKEAPLDGLKAAVCSNINLFMEMNEEEFAKFLQVGLFGGGGEGLRGWRGGGGGGFGVGVQGFGGGGEGGEGLQQKRGLRGRGQLSVEGRQQQA